MEAWEAVTAFKRAAVRLARTDPASARRLAVYLRSTGIPVAAEILEHEAGLVDTTEHAASGWSALRHRRTA